MKPFVAAAATLVALVAARHAEAACQGRPTDPGGFLGYDYAPAEVKSYAGASLVVHYATSGPHAPDLGSTRADSVPDTVAYAADRGDEALKAYGTLGYNAVPSDLACASNGGDAKVDIYLVKFAAADGSTYAECPGAPASGACSSFALVESKFVNRAYADPDEGFRTVVTHELFHAVQNTYRTGEAPFWAEGTAQWAMHQVHPELQDFERQMPDFFADTTRSIDTPPSGVSSSFLYGSAVWPLFLSLRYDASIIRSIFEAAAKSTDDPLTIVDRVLETKGSSLAEEYLLFAAWNVGTKSVASTGGYPDGAQYPGVKTAALTDGATGITSGVGYFTYRGTLTTEQAITLDTDAARNAGVVVPIASGVLQLANAKKLPASASGDVVVVVSGVSTKKTDAPFTLHVQAPAPDAADAGPPATTATRSDGGGCTLSASSSPSGANLAGLVIVLGLFGLRSRRRT